MKRIRPIAFVGGFVMAFGILTSAIGGASVEQHMQPGWWHSNPTLVVDSVMEAPFHTATARSEMTIGLHIWNGTGAARQIFTGAQQNIPNNATLNNVPIGQIWLTNEGLVPTEVLARALTEYLGNQIRRSLIEFDVNNAPWHISALPTQPVGTQDLRSVSAHEIGHAMGFKHVNINCGNRATAQTMCEWHNAATASSQQTHYRTLETHERNDYLARYGN